MGCNREELTQIADEDVQGQLRQNALILKSLSRDIRYGGSSLRNIPELIKKIIREGIWKRHIENIEIIEFDTFEDFVITPLPEGLESTIKQLEALCKEDPEAQRMIQMELKTSSRQGKRNDLKDNLVDNINEVQRPTGTSRAAGIRRLEKSRPDLLAEVEADKISIHRAMIEAGFRKKTVTITVDVEVIAKKLLRTLNQDEIHHLIQLLQENP